MSCSTIVSMARQLTTSYTHVTSLRKPHHLHLATWWPKSKASYVSTSHYSNSFRKLLHVLCGGHYLTKSHLTWSNCILQIQSKHLCYRGTTVNSNNVLTPEFWGLCVWCEPALLWFCSTLPSTLVHSAVFKSWHLLLKMQYHLSIHRVQQVQFIIEPCSYITLYVLSWIYWGMKKFWFQTH